MSIYVHYIEGRGGPPHPFPDKSSTEAGGADVQQQLSDLMASLGHLPGFLSADLLCSPDQPGLCLLESRWFGEVPVLEIPAGCKAWAFTVLESWSPPPQA